MNQLPEHLIPGDDYDREWYHARLARVARGSELDLWLRATGECQNCGFSHPINARHCGTCNAELEYRAARTAHFYSRPASDLERPEDAVLGALYDSRLLMACWKLDKTNPPGAARIRPTQAEREIEAVANARAEMLRRKEVFAEFEKAKQERIEDLQRDLLDGVLIGDVVHQPKDAEHLYQLRREQKIFREKLERHLREHAEWQAARKHLD